MRAGVLVIVRTRSHRGAHRALGPLHRQLAHVDVAHLYHDGVVHYAVHHRLRVRAASHPAVPVLVRVLGAVDRRRAVVPELGELEEEVHLVGGGLVYQPLVHDQDLEARELPQHLLLRDAGGHALLPVGQHVGHPYVERLDPVLAGLLRQGACQVALARAGEALEYHVRGVGDEL